MEIGGGVSRGDVFLVDLNPARGGEIRKTRPCVVVSPDELNAHLRTFIVAPLTTGGHPYPFRLSCRFRASWAALCLTRFARWIARGWSGVWGASRRGRSPGR